MMEKNVQLNQWLWKWHIIAGLISLPFMLLLAVTGVLYLFKADYNQQVYQSQMYVSPGHGEKLSYSQQLAAAQQSTSKPIVGLTLASPDSQTAKSATEFKVKGQGRASNSLYVNPYTGQITGTVEQKQTLMYTIRKLHGELLLSKPGTLTVELVASWFIVLIFTGIYIWWPKKGLGTNKSQSAAGFFTIRTNKSRRLFWRDLHAVGGFWLSIVMLVVVAGGMPWTDVFGSQLKWVQKQTDTGYPKYWRSSKGLASLQPSNNQSPLDLDQLIELAQAQQLQGSISISLPTSETGVVSVSNRALWLEDQQVLHLNQYTGEVVKAYNWDDVGVLMELRQIFMRFHQGEYGEINWWAMVIIGLGFIATTSAGLVSYLYRKNKGSWSIPQVPARFQVDKILLMMIIGLGLLFPMFGASLILIWLWEKRNLILKQPTSSR